MKRHLLTLISVLMLISTPSLADIYRWEDDAGTVHFTDDVSNIPAPFRDKARAVIREAPPPAGSQGAGEPPQKAAPTAPPATAPPPAETPEAAAARAREELVAEVDALKAKIAAKEKLIQYVEEKQSLAVNPLRNRVIDPADQDLYGKYQAELPQDRELLRELETRLESLK